MTITQFLMIPVTWLTLNALSLLAAIAVVVAGWYLARLTARAIKQLLPLAYGVDKNFAPLLSQAARYGILIFAVVTALNLLGVASTSILAVLGAAGLAVALALQNTLANIAAGIMLIWLRPIAIGEFIQGDGVAGVVVEIGLFGTRLRSSSGLYIFTPNQKLWASAITNHSREPRRRIDVNVSVPDTIDIAKSRKILLRIANADKRVLPDPIPNVHVDSFSGAAVNMQLRAWVATPDYLETLYGLTEQAKIALNRELVGSKEDKAGITVGPNPDNPSPETQAGS
ncbi:small conductance mechanosensitive channel [Devosia sp. YR412]|uniref:mechanosensitive ion channel family protein n=1 Tax=Devosia sp. YR412 TaxID=1881030 RepID=UPI0008C900C3|nr:mechanosensitive ion channel domain-containing protein [Devosia sp. YR412]SEP99792.1 small conductance mechanosensitive channel [Devosia sp. YR412]